MTEEAFDEAHTTYQQALALRANAAPYLEQEQIIRDAIRDAERRGVENMREKVLETCTTIQGRVAHLRGMKGYIGTISIAGWDTIEVVKSAVVKLVVG